MKFKDLQDELRRQIKARIDERELIGSDLSRDAAFQRSHLSNFLNSRRGLSLESMDRLLDSLQIGVLDLVDSGDIQKPMLLAPVASGFEGIAVVSAEHAAQLAYFTSEHVRETAQFKKKFLRTLKPHDVCHRSHWCRFVAVRLDNKTVRAVFPSTAVGATLLIDRHYTSLDPYRLRQPNLYVVRLDSHFAIGNAHLAGEHLVLRPRNPMLPVELARIDRARDYAKCMVGRVCHVAIET